jgi:leukotriene-A4 hydrolase
LYEIQNKVGGAEIFEPFMPAYFSHFRFKALSTIEFQDFLYSWFIEKYGESMKEKLDSIDWEKWLYGRGMPPVTPKFDNSRAIPPHNLAKRWQEASENNVEVSKLDFKSTDLKGWSAGQICITLIMTSNDRCLP